MIKKIKMFFYKKYLEWKLMRLLKNTNAFIYDNIHNQQ